MSETQSFVVALLAALPPTLLALASLLKINKSRDENNTKNDIIIEKTSAIHELANGNLTRLTLELAEANKRIGALESQLVNLVKK